MSSFRWSGKRVKEFLEAISDEQTNFKTKPSGRLVKTATGTKVSPNGYFRIDGAHGGWQLVYVLPYSTGVTEVTSGFVGSGELADKLITMGRPGLRQRYRDLEKQWKPIGKRQFDEEKNRDPNYVPPYIRRAIEKGGYPIPAQYRHHVKRRDY